MRDILKGYQVTVLIRLTPFAPSESSPPGKIFGEWSETENQSLFSMLTTRKKRRISSLTKNIFFHLLGLSSVAVNISFEKKMPQKFPQMENFPPKWRWWCWFSASVHIHKNLPFFPEIFLWHSLINLHTTLIRYHISCSNYLPGLTPFRWNGVYWFDDRRRVCHDKITSHFKFPALKGVQENLWKIKANDCL